MEKMTKLFFQYGNAMTKSLPLGIITKKNCPDLQKFNFIIKTISPDDKMHHLFIFNIKFDLENANEKNLLFNKIYTPIFKKDKCLNILLNDQIFIF